MMCEVTTFDCDVCFFSDVFREGQAFSFSHSHFIPLLSLTWQAQLHLCSHIQCLSFHSSSFLRRLANNTAFIMVRTLSAQS